MRLRRWLPAAGFGTLVLIAAFFAARAINVEASAERRERAGETGSVEAARIAVTIERDVILMERLAGAGLDPAAFRRLAEPRLDELPELDMVVLAQLDGSQLVVRTAVPNDRGVLSADVDLAAADALATVVARVLSEADPAAGAPFLLDGRQMITVAAPIVTDAASDEVTRRATVEGAVVGAIDVGRLLSSWDGPKALVAPGGQSVGDDADGDAYRGVVTIASTPWTVLLDHRGRDWSIASWMVLGGGIVLAFGGSILLLSQLDRRRRAEAQAVDRTRQLTRIADAGARLQQSLDLSELLPTFAVSLADDFDLAAVSISLVDDTGDLVEKFATGTATDGPTIEVPLRRGWRAVGHLAVRPRRELDDAERTSLRALGDLLAVAMSNAQLYEREQTNAARLRDLDALKNAFLGTVSHELRTSMTAIIGFSELLADEWEALDDARRRDMADRTRRSAASLRHLVDDLLDFARLEQERLRVSPRQIDLAAIVGQTVDSLTPLLSRHQVDLQVGNEVTAWADPVAVERILANLVSNAAKYAPPDSTVTIRVEANGNTARLVVSDQGPGIPAEERRRIFARFYRLDTPQTVRTRGAGIGLAILRDFADRSRASVTVDDAPGGGARFTIDFPVEASEADAGQPEIAVTQ